MDFFRIGVKEIKGEPPAIFPDFVVGRSKDLMVRGKSFYAVWDEEDGLWSTDEYAVQRLVDNEIEAYCKKLLDETGKQYQPKYLHTFGNNGWKNFKSFISNISDNAHELDTSLTFDNTEVHKTDYVSKRLPYSLCPGPRPAWDELVGTLFSVDERAKIEWAIGAIVSGDSKKIQKFLVFYGPPGSGKGTVLGIIHQMFYEYATTFDAKALGRSSGDFATEVFKSNPLVAIQHDGDLSRIEDNTKLNSVVSHEYMSMNEKYKSVYTARVIAFLLMGTNQPVKITDAKSGLLRRLIDVHPTGVKIPKSHYDALMQQVQFEYGAIAHHCLEVYRTMGQNFFGGYRPLEMMLQTDIFFNFVEWAFDIFKDQDAVSLKQAYALYLEFCNETGIEKKLQQYKVREELRNYFDEFYQRKMVDGVEVNSYYVGFNANKFKEPAQEIGSYSLVVEVQPSILDTELADMPAQNWRMSPDGDQIPRFKWENATTTLKDIDTSDLHFVKVPKQRVIIDFDLKDEGGEKSLERNLEAAALWPPTYAELSKGGNGVHLHYDYEGDNLEELAPLYSTGIEVKTLLGDASLRRRLTACNNVPVASLASGSLPLKEKSPVLSDRTIKTEKGLREMIARNLRKEIHPGTKPSIDFIKFLLDEAVRNGVAFDITDMRPNIIAFANNSTNQPGVCLRTVTQMVWSNGEQQVEDEAVELEKSGESSEEKLAFFDVEVFPNLFVVCWKYEDSDQVVRMINPTPAEMEQLIKMKLVGFYNRRYDNHIIYARYLGYNNKQLYELSQKIIMHNTGFFPEAYNLSYADIWEYSSLRQTLKKFQIQLGLKHQEIDIPWDDDVPEDLIPTVVEYCVNDVLSTEATHKSRAQDFVARQILAELSGLAVNETTQRHTARIIFGNDRNARDKFVYTDLRTEFPGYSFDAGKSTYRGEDVGEGGLVRAKYGMYFNVPLLDVASMHPTSIVQLNAFGPYTSQFAALMEARLAIKDGDFETAGQMFNGKLRPFLTDKTSADKLAYALKIVINIVYGMTSAKFENPFTIRGNADNIVAKRGALFMVDLMHAATEKGLNVVHIKTDSVKIPGATAEDIEEIRLFGEKYGYKFDHELTYDRFCLVNDTTYIARIGWHAKKPELVGTWTATASQFAHPYVFKTLFTGEEITFDDLCETKAVTKGQGMYLDFEHDRPPGTVSESMIYVGKIGRFVPVVEGCGGGKLYRSVDGNMHHVTGTKDHLWMEADLALARGDEVEIDISYFENLVTEARAAIEKFGSFEEFTA